MAEGHVYEVERILCKRQTNGVAEYRIKWKGFQSPEFDTWEPLVNLGSCKQLLKQFEENNQKNQSQKKVKEKARKIAQGLVKKSKQVKNKSEMTFKVKTCKSDKENKSGKKQLLKCASDGKKVKKLKVVIAKKASSKSDCGKKAKSAQLKKSVKDKYEKQKKTVNQDKSKHKKSDSKDKVKKVKLEGSCNTKSIKLQSTGDVKKLNIGKNTKSFPQKAKVSAGNDIMEVLVKKGVKRKHAQEIEIHSDSDSDEDILYSLNDVVTDMPCVKGEVASTMGNNKPKDKVKHGDRKVVEKMKSKWEHDSDGKTVKRRLSLIDSVKKKKGVMNPSDPALPYFSSVKPITAPVRTAMPGSSFLLDKYYGDIPTFPLSQSMMPVSPSSISYKALLANLPMQMHPRKNKKAVESEAEEKVERRISVRTTEYAFRYKQIVVKKCDGYTQIWLNTHTALKNAIDPQVVHEIVSALNSAKYDDSNLVMLSSIGNVFCSGIDLNFLTTGDRRIAARQMVDAVRDLIKTFITFPKPIVAAVPGPAIGLGMAILPLCDVIYASDKALFYLPYSQLSQTPEGCISFTLPLAVGLAVSNELLFAGRKITAMEAYQLGLVSQVFWPTSVMQEVIPRVQHMSMYSAKAMEATKLLIRSHHRTKLELTNETECNLLLERWSTVECHRAIETYLSDEKNFLL
ncbi:testis-specific chromodomain protein Y 2-like [Haliotis rufescens]|uniref:testis-specific chromodomain protein Y 2-like n=1 Tax=Haliotis rufescens TaxID=6454 RepID=UPI00201F0BEB|nr:testis-specific chromodomain protein Y 2-like [Haliotis rufescens]